MMWFLLLLLHTSAHLRPVSLSDPEPGRIILRGERNPCEGHVEVYHGSEMGYVGDKNWDRSTEKVVCKSTHCGKPIEESKNVYRPLRSKVLLNELKCNGGEESLWECDSPGLAVSFYKKPTVKKIKCSNKIKFSLEGHDCEGAVKYIINSHDKSSEETGYICGSGFGDLEASVLCKHLKCNRPRRILKSEWKHWETEMKNMKEMDCSGINNVTHPWQCAKSSSGSCKLPVMISCSDHDRVQLKGNKSNVCSGKLERETHDDKWESYDNKKNTSSDKLCRQMNCGDSGNLSRDGQTLTCSDQVSVVLTDDRHSETKCYGYVGIKVNDAIHNVCGSDWTSQNDEMVCKELNCGTVISNSTVQGRNKAGILDHVICTGEESSLWHCRAKHHRKAQCSSVPFVVCSGSVNVRLLDGPGVCAGRLEVQHKGQWKTAVSENWQDTYSNMVCKQLNCGDAETNSNQKFAKGKGPSLTLTCDGKSSISDCIKDTPNGQDLRNNHISITCTEHKVFILDGKKPCSGKVKIKHGKDFHWLSGSNHTWNQSLADKICQELHCGEASSFNTSKIQTSVVPKSLNCSSGKSLYECDLQDSVDNQTIASVKCKGNIIVTLSQGCWGSVQISTKSKRGYVSAEIWTNDMSGKLCEELSCQKEILDPLFNEPRETSIAYKSLHSLGLDMKLSKYSLVETNDTFQKPAFVVCKGSIKARFEPSRDKCSGNVQVLYENKWLPMHIDALTEDSRNTICKELNCGKGDKVIEYLGPPNSAHLIKTLNCRSNDNSLATCQDVKTEEIKENSELKGLKCSGWSKVALEVEHSCEGEVVVYSEDKRHFVSSEGWTDAEGKTLCKTLNCGEYKEKKNVTSDPTVNYSLWNQRFNCTSKPESIWLCGNNQAANRSKNEKVFLKCEDEPEVALSENCSGLLTINKKPVCGSQWNMEYSHRVCQQLNCGNAFSENFNVKAVADNYYHVYCDEHDYLIGQCKRVKGKCNKGTVSISCAGSVSYNTSQKCGGKVTIKYGNKGHDVCYFNTEPIFTKICNLNPECGPFMNWRNNSKKANSGLRLNCPDQVKDKRYCVENSNQTCPSVSREIICEGYVDPPLALPPQSQPVNPIPIIVGVLFSLILVVLIGTFVRYVLNMRKRKSMVPPDMEEADWDSGEYEDVDKSDELESFGRGRFRSESEVPGERDGESKGSYNYDDIDEVTEVQPLTPQGSMAAKEKDMDQGVIKPSDEGVTYEVEDSKDNYDDIDASPENTETTAEVHDGTRPAPKGDAEAPRDQVHKDEDYLVPGQDG